METITEPTGGRQLVERFWEAAERRDIEAIATMAHPDIVMEWPQSGERFTGRDRAVQAMLATEVKPELAGEPRIVGDGNVWTTNVPLRYGEETYHYVGIYELEDGRVRRSTEFFGAPFPANPARAPFADRR